MSLPEYQVFYRGPTDPAQQPSTGEGAPPGHRVFRRRIPLTNLANAKSFDFGFLARRVAVWNPSGYDVYLTGGNGDVNSNVFDDVAPGSVWSSINLAYDGQGQVQLLAQSSVIQPANVLPFVILSATEDGSNPMDSRIVQIVGEPGPTTGVARQLEGLDLGSPQVMRLASVIPWSQIGQIYSASSLVELLVTAPIGKDGQPFNQSGNFNSGSVGVLDVEGYTTDTLHVPPTLLTASSAASFQFTTWAAASGLTGGLAFGFVSSLLLDFSAPLSARLVVYLTGASDAGAATPGAVSPVVDYLLDIQASTRDHQYLPKFKSAPNSNLHGWLNFWSPGTPTVSCVARNASVNS